MNNTEINIDHILHRRKSMLLVIPFEQNHESYTKEIYIYIDDNGYNVKYNFFLEKYEDASDLYEVKDKKVFKKMDLVLDYLKEVVDLELFNEYLIKEYGKYFK